MGQVVLIWVLRQSRKVPYKNRKIYQKHMGAAYTGAKSQQAPVPAMHTHTTQPPCSVVGTF